VFRRRLLHSAGVMLLLIGISLLIGMVGYHVFAHLESWVDCLYNAAMILGGMGPVAEMPDDGAKIFASDIDTNVLNTARRGVYPVASVDSLEPAVRNRHFMRGVRENSGFVRVRPELGAMITFDQVNLSADEWPFREPFDVIFCRNVMIYFDAKVKAGVLERMHRALRPGGLLFVGHSENFTDRRELFALQGKTVYRRVG
jgi:chemotaxis methyl-accepting protein methylase